MKKKILIDCMYVISIMSVFRVLVVAVFMTEQLESLYDLTKYIIKINP